MIAPYLNHVSKTPQGSFKSDKMDNHSGCQDVLQECDGFIF